MSDEPSHLFCRVNPSLGKNPSLGPIPANLLVPSGAILVGFYILIEVLLSLDFVLFLLLSLWRVSTWWVVVGEKIWRFTHKVTVPGRCRNLRKCRFGDSLKLGV
ncbi:MAG: hypothetical protein F6K00_00235 [Leptolyngbya sp. SIOISBB]|nr:hypothetical protein [Leptolyngbya sp. SIOISBB]